jgi:aspartyl-tRNA(Asn)/glutamyl-tRNA(Gln) amidotransferase subunit A
MDLNSLRDIKTIHELFKSKKLSVVEFTKFHLNKAHELNTTLNCFITITDKLALEQAKASEERYVNGKPLSEIDGIPMSVKDVICVKGIRTTASSKMLDKYISPYTATGIERLIDNGAVILGKNNSDPFAFGGSGENSGYGPAKNPLDISRVPGGSSSGSASGVAAGIGIYSIGTDTGGSVRNPASLTGLVGFKPSYGRNSRYGLISMASSFDTMGVLANTVLDAAIVEDILSGVDPKDSTTHDLSKPNFKSDIDKDISGLIVGIPKEYFVEGLDPDIKKSVMDKVEELKSKGVKVKEISLPHTKYALPTYYILVPSEISSNLGRFDGIRFGNSDSSSTELEEAYIKSRDAFEDEVKRRIIIGTFALSSGYSDEYYKSALKVRELIKRDFENVFKEVDAIITPSMPRVAWKIGEEVNDPLKLYLEDIFTVTANLAGIPGISVKCGEKEIDNTDNSKDVWGNKVSKLPIGLQILTNRFKEDTLFRLASKI